MVLNPQQQQQLTQAAAAAAIAAVANRRAASPATATAAAAVAADSTAAAMAGTSGSSKTSKVLLSRWLQRLNRVIDPKESVWLFCEVLLLLERAQQAAGPAGLPPGCVRPSRLLLHSSGRVTFAAPPAVNGASAANVGEALPGAGVVDAEEEQLYRSPEEAVAAVGVGVVDGASSSSNGSIGYSRNGAGSAAAAGLGPKCDSFSLGVLFFDLFWAAPGGSRAQCIQDLRQRILPPAFLLQRPQEAAFTLALLHPDPDVRPSVQVSWLCRCRGITVLLNTSVTAGCAAGLLCF